MVDGALTNLTGKPTPASAWRSLLSPKEIVGLKVYSKPGPRSGTRPAVVAAVVQGLLSAGLPATNIVIWDRQKEDLIQAGYDQLAKRLGVQLEAAASAGYDTNTFYETSLVGQLVAGDVEFGKNGETVGRKSYVTKLMVNRLTKIINISPLLNHYHFGVTGNLFSLAFGSVENTRRFDPPRGTLAQKAIPEIYAMEAIGDKVVLNIVDALICQYEGEQTSFLEFSTTLNELRFSTDPVALDVLSLYELERQRKEPSKYSSITNVIGVYQIAGIMDIGVSTPRNIRIERMR